MDVELWKSFFCWASLINAGFLGLWFMMLMVAGDWIYKIHWSFFSISRDYFQNIHYALIGGFKLVVIVFNVVPWIVLNLI